MATCGRPSSASRGENLQADHSSADLREQAGHLAETERAKSEFLMLASHELRGPLSLLRGYLSMLKDGSLGVLPPPAARIMPLLESEAS